MHRAMIGEFKNEINTLPNYTSFILAVSGGVDSMVMLDLFRKHVGTDRFKVVHVDHQLRGKSPLDWKAIKKYCQEYSIVHYLESVTIEGEGNIQCVARKLRYDVLYKYACCEDTKIVTAHHKKDHVETVILNMLRGTNLKGLCGIRKLDGKLFRPMLEWDKKQILKYADFNKIEYVEDESNASDKYLRNRVRHDLIPMFESMRMGSLNTISRAALNLTVDSDYLDGLADKAYDYSFYKRLKDGIWMRWDFIQKNHRAIQFRVLQRALRAVTGKHASGDALNQVLDGNSQVGIAGGFVFKQEGVWLKLIENK